MSVGIGLIEIIILSLLVYAIIRFINRNRSRRSHWPVLLVVFGLLLPVPLIMATLFSARSASRAPQQHIVHQSPATVWSNLDNQPFEADIYPGESEAASPLARAIRNALDSKHLLATTAPTDAKEPDADASHADKPPVAEAETEPRETRLTSPKFLMVYGTALNNDTLQRFAQQLQSEFPISEVRYSHDPLSEKQLAEPVEAGGVRLLVTTAKQHLEITQNGHTSEQIKGHLECHVQTSRGATTVSREFIDKPWLSNVGLYTSSRPHQRFVVGYSGELASSAEEARRRAMQDAQDKFRITVDGVTSVTANESNIVDRFAQKLSRPYGDVWREAVLLDVSPERMQPLIEEAQKTASITQRQRFSLAASLAILFGVTVVLCLALNFLTQGYYRNRLFIAGGVLVGLALLATLFKRSV